ncbi:hypothetical protein CEXT_125121 [Caerostris extrusa]|uniref:Uncharacterized protein n=1 Tax=Caerostris extrusa TaxID=172846 RepID=A0AAV4RZX3_CAEEX|nr:hypothetical protein CEXT_125121 [Caerostris extrusa]
MKRLYTMSYRSNGGTPYKLKVPISEMWINHSATQPSLAFLLSCPPQQHSPFDIYATELSTLEQSFIFGHGHRFY